MAVAQIIGHITAVFVADIGQSRIDGQIGTIALRRTGHVNDGF